VECGTSRVDRLGRLEEEQEKRLTVRALGDLGFEGRSDKKNQEEPRVY